MGQLIGEFLPLAVGVAISPIPIIAVILMLFSGLRPVQQPGLPPGLDPGDRVRDEHPCSIASTQDLSSGGQPSDTVSLVKLIRVFFAAAPAKGMPQPTCAGCGADDAGMDDEDRTR